jgi:hypothetical protein
LTEDPATTSPCNAQGEMIFGHNPGHELLRTPARAARSPGAGCVTACRAQHLNPGTGPQGLEPQYYRADGESVFVKPHAQRYATLNQLLGKDELRAAAVRRGAPTWTGE